MGAGDVFSVEQYQHEQDEQRHKYSLDGEGGDLDEYGPAAGKRCDEAGSTVKKGNYSKM